MKIMIVKDRNINVGWVIDFCNMIVNSGHETFFVFDSFKHQEIPEKFSKKLTILNLCKKEKGCFFKNLLKGLKSFFPASFRYAKVLSEIKPDVIICYMLKDLYNVSFLHKYDIPIILMIHNWPPVFFEPLKKKKIRKLIYSKQLEKITGYNLLLESFKGIIEKDFPKKNEYIIGNILAEIPKEKQTDLSLEKKTLTYIGRIDEKQKRQHLVIEAFGKIAQEFPDWNLNFWGDDKYPAYHNFLVKRMTELGIKNQVHFKGFSNNMPNVYQNTDILTWPAKYEGLSVALGEGMAYGIPAIGFKDAPSVNEMIKEGINGFLAKDIDDFALKLKMLMSDKDLRIQMGKKGIEMMKEYSYHSVSEKWNSLLRKITQKK